MIASKLSKLLMRQGIASRGINLNGAHAATRRQADAANDAGAQHSNNTAPMSRADHIHSYVHYSASQCMHLKIMSVCMRALCCQCCQCCNNINNTAVYQDRQITYRGITRSSYSMV